MMPKPMNPRLIIESSNFLAIGSERETKLWKGTWDDHNDIFFKFYYHISDAYILTY